MFAIGDSKNTLIVWINNFDKVKEVDIFVLNFNLSQIKSDLLSIVK